MGRARAAGRGLPPGDQGAARRRSRETLCEPGRLLVLLARRGRLLGGGAASCGGTLAPNRAATFTHPAFDHETRIVAAELGGPGAGLGLRAQRRQGLRGQAALPRGARRLGGRAARGRARRSSCAATSTSRAPTRRAPQGAQARHHRPAAGGARAARGAARPGAWSTSAARSIPTTTTSSPGGRRGATCASATSAGGSTTSWPASRWPRARDRCVVLAEVGTSDHAPVVATFA